MPGDSSNAVPLGRRLATGAEMRVTGPTDRAAVVCVNGGQGSEVEGTWSATLEWLVPPLWPRFPQLGFAGGGHPVKSWERVGWGVGGARGPRGADPGPPSGPARLPV